MLKVDHVHPVRHKVLVEGRSRRQVAKGRLSSMWLRSWVNAASAQRLLADHLRWITAWPMPCPVSTWTPALCAAFVAEARLATLSGTDGAHIPSSKVLLVCGLPMAKTDTAVPV